MENNLLKYYLPLQNVANNFKTVSPNCFYIAFLALSSD